MKHLRDTKKVQILRGDARIINAPFFRGKARFFYEKYD